MQLPLDQAIAGCASVEQPGGSRAHPAPRRLTSTRAERTSRRRSSVRLATPISIVAHVTFAVGDQVLLSTEHLRSSWAPTVARPSSRTSTSDPFKVKRVVNDNAYELDLPPQLQIHPVLNISRLKAYRDGHAAVPVSRRSLITGLRPRSSSRTAPSCSKSRASSAKRGSGARTRVPRQVARLPALGVHVGASLALNGARDAIRDYERRSRRTKTSPKGGRMQQTAVCYPTLRHAHSFLPSFSLSFLYFVLRSSFYSLFRSIAFV